MLQVMTGELYGKAGLITSVHEDPIIFWVSAISFGLFGLLMFTYGLGGLLGWFPNLTNALDRWAA